MTFSRLWLESKAVCVNMRVTYLCLIGVVILADELDEDDDNVHSFEIADAKIDVRIRFDNCSRD